MRNQCQGLRAHSNVVQLIPPFSFLSGFWIDGRKSEGDEEYVEFYGDLAALALAWVSTTRS